MILEAVFGNGDQSGLNQQLVIGVKSVLYSPFQTFSLITSFETSILCKFL